MFKRILSVDFHYSFFLFGPRGSGKTTLLNTIFKGSDVYRIDLLDPEVADDYLTHPNLLKEQVLALSPRPKLVIIDEVQKVPTLLDIVHGLIEKEGLIFALTGSSARKLKVSGANLLAGRAFIFELFPLTFLELQDRFNLESALEWGTLPRIVNFEQDLDRGEFLRAYCLKYLNEEVWGEHLIRELKPFRRFLEIAAQSNGKILNYSKIAKDVNADHSTIKNYFHILEDTHIGFFIEAHHESIRKRQNQNPKFYFFDTGVTRALTRTLDVKLKEQTSAFGEAFEHFIILEIYRLNQYLRKDFDLTYLHTKDGAEIDLILSKPNSTKILIEIKSSTKVTSDDLRHLRHLGAVFPGDVRKICLCREKTSRLIEDVHIEPWDVGIKRIFNA